MELRVTLNGNMLQFVTRDNRPQRDRSLRGYCELWHNDFWTANVNA